MDGTDARGRIWTHTIEVVALLGTGALAAVAVLPGMGVQSWILPATAILTGTVTCLSVFAHSGNGRLSAWILALGAFLGGWTAWAEAARVWSVPVITCLLGAMIVLAPTGALAVLAGQRRLREPGEDGPGIPPEEAEHRAEMSRFEVMLADAGHPEVQVMELQEGRAGRTLRLQLPESGRVTLDGLQGSARNFEVMLRAADGAVNFERGANSAEVVMKVRELFVLRETVPLRRELRAKTISEKFAIGVQEDGSLLKISLRELHMFIVGTTGAGKSNLLNVLITQLASCVDTLIWVIDMKGGRTARPWLQAWAEGRSQAPAIDWVATSREEAAIMMQAFLRAIETRMNSGIGGSKISPSASMPQIILITDETADLLGYMRGSRKAVGDDGTTNSQFIEWAETIAQKGRSEAAASIWATQRGTNDMAGSGTLKSLCKLRIALPVASDAELQYVIPDATAARTLLSRMEDLPGVGVAAIRKKSSQLTKFFWVDHVEGECSEGDNDGCVPACPVYQAAIDVGPCRPPLDRITAAGLGDAYAERWARTGGGLGLAAAAARSRSATLLADGDPARFEDVLREGGVQDTEAKVTPAHRRMLEILAARGVEGASPQRLLDALAAEGIDAVRETVQRWLKADADAGVVHRADYGRWVYGPGAPAREGQ